MPDFYCDAEGIYILDAAGELRSEVRQVLARIRSHDAILGMGHLTYDETEILVREATAIGITKIVVDHPQFPFSGLSIEEQQSLVQAGAMMNYVFATLSPKWSCISVPELVKQLKSIGPENIVLPTDLGQLHNPLPAE